MNRIIFFLLLGIWVVIIWFLIFFVIRNNFNSRINNIEVNNNSDYPDLEYMIISEEDIETVENYFSWWEYNTWNLENNDFEEENYNNYNERRIELVRFISWINYPKECIENKSFFKDLQELKYCIHKKEDDYIRSINEYTKLHCERLVYRKEECYDDLYFDESLKLLDIEKCQSIVNKSKKLYCINLVDDYQKEEIVEKEPNECDFINKTNLTVNCVSKLAVENNDMRFCRQYLEWNDIVKCENNVSNVVIQNVLLEVMEKWDKSKCDSIILEEYKNICIGI